jgi:peptidoglycan hydrolase-like protein with peptidoglycan-binding domain
MTAGAQVDTTSIQLELPVLKQGSGNTHPDAVAHLQHMLNDLDRFTGGEVLLNENGEYGPKTTDRVKRFQRDNGIQPTTGAMGQRTWTGLLRQWLSVDQMNAG